MEDSASSALQVPHLSREIRAAVGVAVCADFENAQSALAAFISTRPQQFTIWLAEVGHHVVKIPEHLSSSDVRRFKLAGYLWDVHTALVGYGLSTGWRSAQLAEVLVGTLNRRDLIAAASMARGLVETAASFSVEAPHTTACYVAAKDRGLKTETEARQLRGELIPHLKQILFGTRLPDAIQKRPHLQRTNILTFVAKAEKNCPGVKEWHDQLCDVVHPSWGSSAAFWEEAGVFRDQGQVRMVLERHALRCDEIGKIIIEASAWATRNLLRELSVFARTCDDIDRTLKLKRARELLAASPFIDPT